ncbi:hypothetical protein BV22DRAFT_643426 [Leucogyrophana mollusca]|uniref:Uncharacterized protein n=1 Tax=Leucogyrophana mollusca TaxID=85980 RepID=A0ACB8BCZ7_9AGAM|nr:hypothetical protein BV22DRAFT_643426 [Leucogyrophana mollusca]
MYFHSISIPDTPIQAQRSAVLPGGERGRCRYPSCHDIHLVFGGVWFALKLSPFDRVYNQCISAYTRNSRFNCCQFHGSGFVPMLRCIATSIHATTAPIISFGHLLQLHVSDISIHQLSAPKSGTAPPVPVLSLLATTDAPPSFTIRHSVYSRGSRWED